jgi:hypothetical protein
MKKRACRLLAAVPLVMCGHAALANVPIDADQIPEIVVTAQKRTESLQAVPVSITTFGAEALTFSQYEVALVGKNLTNDHANLADNRSIAVELPGRPRIVTNQPITFGIEFRATFK